MTYLHLVMAKHDLIYLSPSSCSRVHLDDSKQPLFPGSDLSYIPYELRGRRRGGGGEAPDIRWTRRFAMPRQRRNRLWSPLAVPYVHLEYLAR